MSLRPADTVRHAEIDGARVILDLNAEAYRILDDVASVMWAVLTGEAGAARSLDALGARYDVEPARLRTDLDAFARRCLAEGLLAPDDARAVAPPPPLERARYPVPHVLGALRSLVATQWRLRRTGFRATYDRYAAIPAGTSTARLPAALATYVQAENVFVAGRAPDDCLVRSLSLYRFLRSAGIPAEHVLGVRRFPFQAHAWVECDGSPLLDDSRRRRFTPLARIGVAHAAGAGA